MWPLPEHQPCLYRGTHRCRGFTLIEMLVVMTLIALLLTLAVPRYFTALDSGRINVQRQNLATMRDAIDKYRGDQGKYPDSLEDLVSKRYLRSIPVDPVSEVADWMLVAPEDPSQGGIFDVMAMPRGEATAPANSSTSTSTTTNPSASQ